MYMTRFPYYAMLAAGDQETIAPFVSLLRSLKSRHSETLSLQSQPSSLFCAQADYISGMLPFARRRVSSYYGHAGAIFYESKYVWGAAQIENFDHCVPRNLTACRRLNVSSDTCDTVNPYIRHHYYGSVEMAVLMLQHVR